MKLYHQIRNRLKGTRLVSKKELLAKALDWTGMNLLARNVSVWNGLLVLNYHRVGDINNSVFDHDLWSASAEDFEKQIRFLSLNFDMIRIRDLDHIWNQPRGRYVLVTFDDGYLDNYEWAFPIIKSYNAPATFFLTTAFLDDRKVAWWDEISWMVRSATRQLIQTNELTGDSLSLHPDECEQSIKILLSRFKKLSGDQTENFLNFLAEATGAGRCPQEIADYVWMTWDMIREMSTAGMDIGGHTVTHPILSRHSPEIQQFEIEHCKQRIETEIGQEITSFSYPVGGKDCFNQHTRDCLKQAGFRWGFSYYGGFAPLGKPDPWDLPRIAVESEEPASLFRSSVSIPQVFSSKKCT
ncbi:Polysaccharide deacetylase [Gimesia maris]|nr:Polysaccharide deacetylase [Gimesia maris]